MEILILYKIPFNFSSLATHCPFNIVKSHTQPTIKMNAPPSKIQEPRGLDIQAEILNQLGSSESKIFISRYKSNLSKSKNESKSKPSNNNPKAKKVLPSDCIGNTERKLSSCAIDTVAPEPGSECGRPGRVTSEYL
jgi:hypothetical protein